MTTSWTANRRLRIGDVMYVGAEADVYAVWRGQYVLHVSRAARTLNEFAEKFAEITRSVVEHVTPVILAFGKALGDLKLDDE